MFKHYIKFLFYIVILFQLQSCQSQQKDLGNIFHKGNGAEPQTLDPHKAEGVPASNILRDLYEGLVEVSPSGEPILAAAKSYQITNNGKTYTFQLRENKWSNGDRVTAQDFEYGLKRSIDPETGSKYSLILSPILNAMDIINGKKDVSELGVTALSDNVLQIQLESPTPYFFDLVD